MDGPSTKLCTSPTGENNAHLWTKAANDKRSNKYTFSNTTWLAEAFREPYHIGLESSCQLVTHRRNTQFLISFAAIQAQKKTEFELKEKKKPPGNMTKSIHLKGFPSSTEEYSQSTEIASAQASMS